MAVNQVDFDMNGVVVALLKKKPQLRRIVMLKK
jgi:hypothetical protein